MVKFETWDVYRGWVFVYTEDYAVTREMRKEFGSPTVYFCNGRACAWQFLVPRRVLTLLQRKIELTSPKWEKESEQQSAVDSKIKTQ